MESIHTPLSITPYTRYYSLCDDENNVVFSSRVCHLHFSQSAAADGVIPLLLNDVGFTMHISSLRWSIRICFKQVIIGSGVELPYFNKPLYIEQRTSSDVAQLIIIEGEISILDVIRATLKGLKVSIGHFTIKVPNAPLP